VPATMWHAHSHGRTSQAHRLPNTWKAVSAELVTYARCCSCTCRRRALPEHCRSDFSAATRMAAAASAGLGPGTAPCCDPCGK
jgi:hypothetical protein